MQYPIIDNFSYAYIMNNWTGLNIKPINIWNEQTELGVIGSDGQNSPSSTSLRTVGYIRVTPNTEYYYRGYATNPYLYDINKNYIGRFGQYISNRAFTIPDNCYYIRIAWAVGYGTTYNYDISVNFPSSYTAYISQQNLIDNKKEIAKLLKLPMIHYFPHPVIDALISAADGQHTEEEKEILRHYLTPLGIGGI